MRQTLTVDVDKTYEIVITDNNVLCRIDTPLLSSLEHFDHISTCRILSIFIHLKC